jgi:hypothetical protein
VLHLPIISAIGDTSFLFQLLSVRLSAEPNPVSATVSLPLLNISEAQRKHLIAPVDVVVNLLVAVEARRAPGEEPVADWNDASALRFTAQYYNHVLSAPAAPDAIEIRALVAPTPELRQLNSLVRALIDKHDNVSQLTRTRYTAAASKLSELCKKLMTAGSKELLDVAWHGYCINKGFLPVIAKIIVHQDTPPATVAVSAEPVDYRRRFSEAAKDLFIAVASMQPLGLIYRSKLPKTDSSKAIAAQDWNEVRGIGAALIEFVAAEQQQVHDLLDYLRRLTSKPDLASDIFASEAVYFTEYILAASKLSSSTSMEDMKRLWIPSAVKCCLGDAPALRSAGHFMLSSVMLRQHPVSISLFATYVNMFVAVPRPAREAAAEPGYGPVPADSVKLFARIFARVVLAIELLEPNVASKEIDGAGMAQWGINKLAGACAYYLALLNPTANERDRRKQYFCALIDCLQCVNPEVTSVARRAIEKLLLSLRQNAEAVVFLDYASGVVENCRQSVTKRSTVEWLLDMKAALDARSSQLRAKL